MTQSRRVVSPRIVRPPNYGLRAFLVLLTLAAIAMAVGAAFLFGIQQEREASMAMVERMRATERERDALTAQVAELRQQALTMERSHQIDREANRAASKQLKGAQDERLALEKELSFLRRLIREGGGGILQSKDFKLEKTETPGDFGYSFTVQQLIQDFGDSTGNIDIQIIGNRNGEEIALPLSKLKGSEPTNHNMSFKHFQNFEGMIRIPADFEPENLVVDIKPDTAKLIPVSETYPWNPEQ